MVYKTFLSNVDIVSLVLLLFEVVLGYYGDVGGGGVDCGDKRVSGGNGGSDGGSDGGGGVGSVCCVGFF